MTVAYKTVEFWQQKVNDLQQREAEAATQEAIRAREETRYADPAIKAIAQKNVELAQIQTKLVDKIKDVTVTATIDNTIEIVYEAKD